MSLKRRNRANRFISMRLRLTLSLVVTVALVVTIVTTVSFLLVRQTMTDEMAATAEHQAQLILDRIAEAKAEGKEDVLTPSGPSAGATAPEPSDHGSEPASNSEESSQSVLGADDPLSGIAVNSGPVTSSAVPSSKVPRLAPQHDSAQFDTRAQVYLDGSKTPVHVGAGPAFPVPSALQPVIDGKSHREEATEGDYKYFAFYGDADTTVVIRESLGSYNHVLQNLAAGLILLTILGVIGAFALGYLVFTMGIQPLKRFQRSVDNVTYNDDLTPIPVVGNDEIAELTVSFNKMLEALSTSRQQQADLVSDAGHELKTPLTSLRTNIELLMMVSKSDSEHQISEAERESLEKDVMAQIEELTRLVGDLVDLARQDQHVNPDEEVELDDLVSAALERVRRRRPDVTFTAELSPWWVWGDSFGLGRAVVNILDNAGKWSPPEGEVQVKLKQLDSTHCELTVADSGPGIPEQDREKVFDRFYRSISARSMPGSGLGLAIVKKVVDEHGGTIEALESPGGGALIRVVLPGAATHSELPASS